MWCWLTHWGSWQCYLRHTTTQHIDQHNRPCVHHLTDLLTCMTTRQSSRGLPSVPILTVRSWSAHMLSVWQILLYCTANILRDTIVLAVTGCLNNMVVCCMIYCIDYALWYQRLLDVYWFNVTLYICWVVLTDWVVWYCCLHNDLGDVGF